jgi:hypothetical protein
MKARVEIAALAESVLLVGLNVERDAMQAFTM